MDSLVCPRLTGIVKFTQKLMMKVQKKKNDGNMSCPICACKSPKGNLCRDCFMRSFAPIAYSRNIKVVERNEIFYGMGKDKGWATKKQCEQPVISKRCGDEDEADDEIMNSFVVSARHRNTITRSMEDWEFRNEVGLVNDPSVFNGKTLTELFEPAVSDLDVEQCTNSIETKTATSVEMVDVELNEDMSPESESMEYFLEPLPKLVPDFWETDSEDERSSKLTTRFKSFKDHFIKQAQRSFNENFGGSKIDRVVTGTDNGKSTDEGLCTDENSSPESLKLLEDVKKKFWKQTQTDSFETNIETLIQPLVKDNHDCPRLSKRLKQKTTLELLKVAFKTNMILNSLSYYFKKIVESESSNSESQSDNNQEPESHRAEGTAPDGKISVDSFFFPSKHSAVLWGHETRATELILKPLSINESTQPNEAKNYESEKESVRANSTRDSRSEGEIQSKSQAKLSMLLNKCYSCISFDQGNLQESEKHASSESSNCSLYVTEYDSKIQRLNSVMNEQKNEATKNSTGRKQKMLYRGALSEADCCKPPHVTRKFLSEHSRIVEDLQPNENCWNDDSGCILSESDSTDEKTMNSVVRVKCDDNSQIDRNLPQLSVYSSLVDVSDEFDPPSSVESDHSQKSLLDLVFGLNRNCVKPSLLPLPDFQPDLITLSTPETSQENLAPSSKWKDAISQTTLSARHMEQEMNLLHKAFLDQLAHFSVQLVESCRTFGHSWQTSFLAELVEHFRSACNIISEISGDSPSLALPSSEKLDELQNISNKISLCLAKLRAYPHSFIGDCMDHDISTLLSSPPGQEKVTLVNTWV